MASFERQIALKINVRARLPLLAIRACEGGLEPAVFTSQPSPSLSLWSVDDWKSPGLRIMWPLRFYTMTYLHAALPSHHGFIWNNEPILAWRERRIHVFFLDFYNVYIMNMKNWSYFYFYLYLRLIYKIIYKIYI